ncbi:putative transcription factor interactor and regulator CCHC(Zn) family [Helianthus annuus]|nr:putative transcription factor interactor and regulator CCHC(Zn) family [Helianthus annuus]KAJ0949725.1 putative transcription factor interactor and regulator CCHC(Zn) family [Helianthus annuus]
MSCEYKTYVSCTRGGCQGHWAFICPMFENKAELDEWVWSQRMQRQENAGYQGYSNQDRYQEKINIIDYHHDPNWEYSGYEMDDGHRYKPDWGCNGKSEYFEDSGYGGNGHFNEYDSSSYAQDIPDIYKIYEDVVKLGEFINALCNERVKRESERLGSDNQVDSQSQISESIAESQDEVCIEESDVEAGTPARVIVDDNYSPDRLNMTIGAIRLVASVEDEEENVPMIPVQLGEFKTERALVDHGASISILAGRVFDEYNFGELEKVDTTVVLADGSRKPSRGMLRGIAVRVGDCYYPEDFLVVDHTPSNVEGQPPVILGRPFLKTAKAIIDCNANTVNMVFGSRKFSLNFMSHTCAYSNISNKCHPPINEDVPKESVAMIDRSKDEKVVKDKVVKSPWWLKMRNKKRSVKLEKESPKDATESKKRPLEMNMGEVSQLKEKKKPTRKIKGEFLQSIDFDNPDHLDAIWSDGWQWDTNHLPAQVFLAREMPFEPP